MNEVIQSIVVIVIMLCGLSLILTSLSGKHDAFLLVRPIGRFGKRQAKQLVGGSYRLLKRWANSTWRVAINSRQPAWRRIVCGLISSLFAAGVIALWLPAEIVGSGKK